MGVFDPNKFIKGNKDYVDHSLEVVEVVDKEKKPRKKSSTGTEVAKIDTAQLANNMQYCQTNEPYINKENYAETLYELIEIFYEYKNETMDLITDDELIAFMKKSFDGICQGNLEYLSGTILYKMRRIF